VYPKRRLCFDRRCATAFGATIESDVRRWPLFRIAGPVHFRRRWCCARSERRGAGTPLIRFLSLQRLTAAWPVVPGQPASGSSRFGIRLRGWLVFRQLATRPCPCGVLPGAGLRGAQVYTRRTLAFCASRSGSCIVAYLTARCSATRTREFFAALPGPNDPGGAPGISPFAVLTRPMRVGAFPPVSPTCRFLADPLRRYRSKDRTPWKFHPQRNESAMRRSIEGQPPRLLGIIRSGQFILVSTLAVQGRDCPGLCLLQVFGHHIGASRRSRIPPRPSAPGAKLQSRPPLSPVPAVESLCPLPGPIRSWVCGSALGMCH